MHGMTVAAVGGSVLFVSGLGPANERVTNGVDTSLQLGQLVRTPFLMALATMICKFSILALIEMMMIKTTSVGLLSLHRHLSIVDRD